MSKSSPGHDDYSVGATRQLHQTPILLTQQFDLVPSLLLRSLQSFSPLCVSIVQENKNILDTVLLHIHNSIFVVPSKVTQPIPLIPRFHLSDLHPWFPIPDNIGNLIEIALGTNHCHHCRRSELRNANGDFSGWKISPHKLLAVCFNHSCCPLLCRSPFFLSKTVQIRNPLMDCINLDCYYWFGISSG